MDLREFDAQAFLRDCWQKRPALIRNPWAEWENPLDPDDLAGLACEPGIEARLVTGSGADWTVEHGPLPEDRFASLGEQGWTLLVQAVDHHVPAVAALLEPFRFIPNWRIDDVMVSYAADGGGVGPHYDQYDVFLIQGLGRRRWRVGRQCDEHTPLRPHADLRLLAEFTAAEEWVLEPGDILYLPPGFAHDGTAVGPDCMTYSVGFRAPSRAELVEGWCDHLLDALGDAEHDRYRDPDLQPSANPGELSASAIERLHALVLERMADRASFARWVGGHVSSPKYADADWRPQEPLTGEELAARLLAGEVLQRNPASRFVFVRQGTQELVLFVDGAAYACSGSDAQIAERLCAEPSIQLADDEVDAALALLEKLITTGALGFAEEDETD